MSGRLRAASEHRPDGSGRLLVGPANSATVKSEIYVLITFISSDYGEMQMVYVTSSGNNTNRSELRKNI